MEEFLRESEKANALATVGECSVASKNSLAYKLLCSVIYDLGKALAAQCQIDKRDSRQFFDGVVSQFWAAFPNIDGDAAFEGSSQPFKSLKIFVRARLQQSFSKNAGKLQENVSLADGAKSRNDDGRRKSVV